MVRKGCLAQEKRLCDWAGTQLVVVCPRAASRRRTGSSREPWGRGGVALLGARPGGDGICVLTQAGLSCRTRTSISAASRSMWLGDRSQGQLPQPHVRANGRLGAALHSVVPAGLCHWSWRSLGSPASKTSKYSEGMIAKWLASPSSDRDINISIPLGCNLLQFKKIAL